jgi:uncharacterized protein YndB with AHSA1/START domain
VPSVRRSRLIEAPPERLWDVVADPAHLPRWWPGVQRVEEATATHWTKVMRSPKGGKAVRADFTLVRAEAPSSIAWEQEVEESPFERFLSEAVTEIELDPEEAGTLARIRVRRKLRGLARLGGLMVRRATARQLDEALEGLARVTEDP